MNEWVKAWRPRPGSAFEARVSAFAKDWFRGLLVHFDDEGHFHLPKAKTAHAAVGMALGYTKGDRRRIASLLAELIEHGCLIAEQEDAGFWTLTAPNWGRFQAKKRGEKKVPPTSPPSTTSAPTAYPKRKMGTARGSRIPSNSAESHNPDVQEKRREEERENARANDVTNSPRFADPLGEIGDVSAGRLPTRLWALAMRELSSRPWDESLLSGRDRDRLTEITDWAVTTANVASKQGGDWSATYVDALRGSLVAFRDEYRKRPGSVPLSPGGWWARRESWRQAA